MKKYILLVGLLLASLGLAFQDSSEDLAAALRRAIAVETKAETISVTEAQEAQKAMYVARVQTAESNQADEALAVATANRQRAEKAYYDSLKPPPSRRRRTAILFSRAVRHPPGPLTGNGCPPGTPPGRSSGWGSGVTEASSA